MKTIDYTVRSITDENVSRWNNYVYSADAGTFFHLAEWKSVLERSFGHRTHFMYVEQNGQIRGILPLAELKSRIFGHSLVSTPFCVYGGILADDDTARDCLRRAACSLANRLGVGALELRNTHLEATGWPEKSLYVTFRRAISSDNEENLKAIPRKQRAMVRKGINGGLVSEADQDSRRLYKIYSESVRNLGTPVFTSRYLDVLQQVFGDRCRILMASSGGRDIAGVMSFYFRDQVLPYYGGSIAAARSIQGANDFMYWELLRRSANEGFRIFDFGRSKIGTGPYNFKKNWGFTPEPLHYQYYLVKAASIPEVNPTNPRYRFFIDAWKKLPLSVANSLGPALAKNLG